MFSEFSCLLPTIRTLKVCARDPLSLAVGAPGPDKFKIAIHTSLTGPTRGYRLLTGSDRELAQVVQV